VANLIDQAIVEQRMGGPKYLVMYADDDADGTADAAIVTAVLDEASRIAEGILWAGFPSLPQIATLAASDTSVRGAIADVACGLFGDRRPELVIEAGKPAQHWRREQGERVLKQIARTDRRAPGEATAGVNTQLSNRTSREKPPTTFVFSDTGAQRAAGGRGPGGF
jgi:hypothetical protein